MAEIYIATVVETDGPIPGPHSILSIGSVAYQRDKAMVSSFSTNLETLPDAEADPDVLACWKSKPEAWAVCRYEPEPPGRVMLEYVDWLLHLPGEPVYVGYPASPGFQFVSWYLHRFTGRNPFGTDAIDVRTMAMALLGKPYRKSVKRNMPDAWLAGTTSHTYVALDDAISVGTLFCHMLDAAKAGRRSKDRALF